MTSANRGSAAPHVVVASDTDQAGELAADAFAEVLTRARDEARDAVFGFATGSTPLPVYAALARRHLDFSQAWGFTLDEYVGLPAQHPELYEAVIEREVIGPLGFARERMRYPGGVGHVSPRPEHRAALDADCLDFEANVDRLGGIDLQLLGIGANGHVAFNEPGSPFDSRTRVVELTDRTRRDNARFFPSLNEVPTHAVTQGLGTIARARILVM
ncbi:MAG TPA: glucosamine-6-phosphate deaminase, partial [Terrimesophilobacter sp.]|nr:glucosamine-6-phosphate deaminase [Terrimesophilobacter sp.]